MPWTPDDVRLAVMVFGFVLFVQLAVRVTFNRMDD